jgi:hypothetical protein
VQVRHAWGIHNIVGEKDFGDIHVTQTVLAPLGWNEVRFCSFFFLQLNQFLSTRVVTAHWVLFSTDKTSCTDGVVLLLIDFTWA